MTTTMVLLVTSLMTVWALCHADFKLTLMHTNDIHARFDQFNKYGSGCSADDASHGKCFGGYARLMTAVRQVRNQYRNTLLLDAGDQYQGTLYFYTFADVITSFFMNWVEYNVMTLGNHEFDLGVGNVVRFLKKVNFPVVSANIDTAQEPTIQGRFRRLVVLSVGGHLVGVVGYTTVDTPYISSPGNLKFYNVVQSVEQEVQQLTSQGVKVIIALGHAGFKVDQEVAKIPGVDVVIGGHTNTFLYTGEAPSSEVPAGEYPTVVTREDGTRSVVAQCYTWAKYLCVLHLTFSEDNGILLSWSGNPWLLNSTVPQDDATVSQLTPYKAALKNKMTEVVGRTTVKLEGDRKVCRTQECNLGNLVADSMVSWNRNRSGETGWTDVNIAVVNGGSIRASIGIGNITIGSVVTVLPFRPIVGVYQIQGRYLKETFEHSVSRLDPCKKQKLHGRFLQVSGLQVTYNLSQPVGQRLVSLKAKCTGCPVSRLVPVDDNEMYKLLINNYIAEGGDGYQVLKDHAQMIYTRGDADSDILVEHVKRTSPIHQGVEGRINYVSPSIVCGTGRT